MTNFFKLLSKDDVGSEYFTKHRPNLKEIAKDISYEWHPDFSKMHMAIYHNTKTNETVIDQSDGVGLIAFTLKGLFDKDQVVKLLKEHYYNMEENPRKENNDGKVNWKNR